MKSIKVESPHPPMGHADFTTALACVKNNHRLRESEIRTGFIPLRAGNHQRKTQAVRCKKTPRVEGKR